MKIFVLLALLIFATAAFPQSSGVQSGVSGIQAWFPVAEGDSLSVTRPSSYLRRNTHGHLVYSKNGGPEFDIDDAYDNQIQPAGFQTPMPNMTQEQHWSNGMYVGYNGPKVSDIPSDGCAMTGTINFTTNPCVRLKVFHGDTLLKVPDVPRGSCFQDDGNQLLTVIPCNVYGSKSWSW